MSSRPQSQKENLPIRIEENQEATKVAVHIGGAVRSPGLYYLDSTDRVADAVEKAGGPTSDADLDSINLASHITDGMKILVPSKSKQSISEGLDSSTNNSSSSSGKININTASSKELDGLPGIGEVLAQRIVSYRESNGPFKSIEDLLKVSGIGKKKLDGIRDLIVVE
ncbi:MAG: helix-hairpin-helix domain-containing protein [bacterium]